MTANIVPSSQFRELIISDHPLLDARAPVEFAAGAFPASSNLPLMQDSEREQVGICFKKRGQAAAIELGEQLVSGEIKQQRIDAWLSYLQQYPDAYLYCFRGGLRSQITQKWLKEAGIEIPYLEGGYKAMRQYLLSVIEAEKSHAPIFIVSGSTGCGKTEFLLKRSESIDLEGIAHHRGSSFGRRHDPQPTQINFDNQLATDLLKHQQREEPIILLEDESFLIGRSAIAKPLFQQMQAANIILLEESNEQRLQRLLDEYVHFMHQGYVERFGVESGLSYFNEYLVKSITSIKKRLGGKLHDEFQTIIANAIAIQSKTGETQAHLEWIELLLTDYYDPMYKYQLDKKRDRVVFSGDQQTISQWLDEKQYQ